MPPISEAPHNFTPKQKKRLKELFLEKLIESEVFGREETAESDSVRPTRILKSEMSVALDDESMDKITLADFLKNEFFPIIELAKTYAEMKRKISAVLIQMGNEAKLDMKQRFLEKSLRMRRIFDDACVLLDSETYEERKAELLKMADGKGDERQTEAEIIPLFDPKGGKR